MDVYAISATTGQIDISKSTHTVVDMQAVLPLRSWTHLVFQGSSLNQDNLSVYVNGKLCPAAGADAPNGTCGWELSNGVYPENLAYLKQIRYYNRELTTAEIAANAAEACMSLASDYYDALSESLIYRGRFNVPAEGSAGTIDGGTTESQYSAVYPSHGMASSYAFQSLNSISVQNTPDGGVSKSWYDRKGNLVVTQNAQQATFNKFTYTLFDGQNRVVEVGEKSGASLAATDRYISDDNLITFQNRGTNSQITHSYFDVPYLDNGFTYNQNNLRKRVAALTYRENQTDDVEEVTYYSYDQLGNAGTIWQQIKGLEIKQIEYQYDFATSKVNKLRYQYLDNKTDKFWYGYQYDADNRVVKATTGINSFSSDGWDIENPKTDATYHYYLHGLLAREELGNDPLVQGNDYIYTLQKWPKAANGQYLSPDYDFGQDGKQGTSRSVIGPDVYGYSLDYYKGDYKPIDNTKALPLSWTANSTSEVGSDLYNGNISRSTVALSQFNNTVGYSYRYDQLNRLKGMRQHALSLGANDWSASTAGSAFKEDVTYDGNGNILTYLRNGSGAGGKAVAMDNLTYGYSKDNSGNLVNNKLLQVKDAVSSGEYTEDLKSQNDNNYQYDNIGNLTADVQAGISNIEWTVYGKIKSIIKTDGSAMEYRYDALGNRVYKGYTHNGITEKTWYVRDAIGNVLAVYGNKDGDGNIYWKEQHLYGSNRLGVWEPDMLVSSGNESSIWDLSGNKHFELANHLGNVLATITDNLSVDNKAIVNSAQDYYPFGMMQPDRHYDDNSYRYGFNGKENDIEFGLQDYGMRIYNPSLGKFLSVDPLSPKYPELTPYQFASNRPIEGIDQDGMEVAYYDPQNKFYYMASDAIRHPLPKGIVLPSNGAAAYAGQNGFNTMVAMGGVVLIVVAPEIIMLGGRAYQTIVITVSQPQNQILIAQTGTFVAGLLNPGPEDIDPNSEMDELGRYVRGIVGKLGKNAVGFLRMMQKEGFCFTGNTQVLTKDGFKNIENIEVGDSVYSCSVLKIDSSGNYKNKVELQRVSNIFKHAINKLVQISLDGSDIISTLTHPYFANGLWTKAGELKIGDSLYDANGHIKRIIGVRNIDTSYINVFNFEVESNHNYYVSSEKVLVHNNCAPVWISEQYGKHILWSFKNKLLSKMSWKDVIKWTKDNEAIYKSAVKEEVRTLEMTAISEGLEVPIGKGVKYFIYDAGKVIGASEGKETQYLRVELASDGSVHGHPITDVDYRKYLKKIKN
ncbi:polymorphic toxin-type HINT domain-containing protein [Chitinophaga sancti]|uniref:polymorphic toxin-type HINT domain-containing protein n=1 Tax=Chitinophaga sancti TaxID=1004 RepID=UPI002A75E0B2|nr:polymorphic toxin-type HINT domain-containing protein [Chitinophaga sancti]WPQ60685.1 polymorphic toxin-type HINT domain-containing protein [Chitinophaga sancti]